MRGAITLFLLLTTWQIFAQSTVDPSFGMSGFTVVPHTTESTVFVFDDSGNIYGAGYTLEAGGGEVFHLSLTKMNQDGLIDSSFGLNGVVTTSIAYSEFPLDVLCQPDGKIIVTGLAFMEANGTGDHAGFAVRYYNDGLIDSSFATNGIYLYSGSASDFQSVLLLQDGTIILGGNSYSGDLRAILVKLDSSGVPDNQFGTNGTVSLNDFDFDFEFSNAVLLSDNHIICVGADFSAMPNPRSACCKIDVQGNFDFTFGQDGKVIADLYDELPYTWEGIQTVEELPDHKILLSGNHISGFLARINIDGTFDPSFGTNGVLDHQYPHEGLTVQPDGKILLGGTKELTPDNYGYSFTRLLPDGTLDTSFNENGIFDRDISPHHDYLKFMRLQDADKLIVGGSSQLDAALNATFTRIILDNNLSIEDHVKETPIVVYPNPFNDRIFIEDLHGQIEEIRLLDNTGKLLNEIPESGSGVYELLNRLPPGLYYLHIDTKDGNKLNKKMVKI